MAAGRCTESLCYGQGTPVIAILAEFDALPGITQDAVPERRPLDTKDAGHACGHHLFGTGSTAAAIAVKDWLAASGASGTVRLYGTPAEEGGGGKVYMVNLMREHVTEDSRIHYVITSGGSAPNVVPDFAEVFYYVRHPDPREVASMFERVVKASEGAAMGTGTTVDHEVIHGLYAMLENDALARVMDRNLRAVGGVEYTAEERAFAEAIRKTLPPDAPPVSAAAEIATFEMKEAGGSTDVADVSWVVPTTGLRTATWVPGTAAHSWQAIAAGGTSIGTKGMLVAAKTLALTAIDLMRDPALITAAREEYQKRVGPDFVYVPLVGNRPPPLDYRRK